MSSPGLNEMLVGATGSGKTYSLRTLVDAGLEVFVIATEPGIASSLGDIPPERLHWHYVAPANPGLSSLMDSARKINTMSMKGLANLTDINKAKYGQFLEVLSALANFKCDRTGEEYGSVETWDTSRAIVVDSLTGLNLMAMDLVVGAKPVKSMGDWGIAMDNLERLITMLCTGVRCHFVLTAHLEREQDVITGAIMLMASTLGKKLGPKIPRFFDDVIQCIRLDDGTWGWATQTLNVDTKTRNLPYNTKLTPSFEPVIHSWLTKGGVIPQPQPEETETLPRAVPSQS